VKTNPREALEALKFSDPAKYQEIVKRQKRFAFKPHSAGQAAVANDETRFISVRAGRRYGKTKVAARRIVRHAMRHPGVVDWWVANTYKNVRRGYREVLRQLPPQFLKKPAPPATANDLILELVNGTRIEFYSSTNPDSMAGEGVAYVVMDEAALQSENTWVQIVRPTLMDYGGGAFFISTPRGRNWFWEIDKRGSDPRFPNYKSYHFRSHDNPYLAREELEEMEATMADVFYRQEVLAEFIDGAASIFMVDPDTVLEDVTPLVPGSHVIMGVDLAKKYDFTVLTAADLETRLPVFHDRFKERSWPVIREEVKTQVGELIRAGASAVTVMVDSTGVGDVIFDDLDESGMDVVGIPFSQQWKHKAVKLLSADLQQGGAFILEAQRHEFEAYEYEITKAGNFIYSAPEGGHDDEVSAKLLEHWGIVHEGGPQEVKTIASERPPAAEEAAKQAMVKKADAVKPRSASDLMDDPSVWG
jgi:hypothetical protein